MDSPDLTRAEALLGEAQFVHSLARALLRDADLAHDVAQDALLAGLQQQGQVRQWRSWLLAVTRRLAGAAAAERRQRAVREARAAPPEGGDREQRTAARLALHRQLCDAVLALPEPYRTAVTLRYLDGLSPRAIGRQLQREVGLVRQHVHRGLVLLRQRLDRDFGDRSGWTAAFAACGLGIGGTTTTLTMVSVLVMKKVLLAAVFVLAIGSWWTLRGARDEAPPGGVVPTTAGPALAGTTTDAHGPEVPPPIAVPATAPERTEVAFAVQVVDEAERALAGVTVRCWRQLGEAIVRDTGADGRAAFPPFDGPGLLRVEAAARPPLLRAVAEMVGEQRIVLGRGAEVSGLVLVDGEPAPPGLQIGMFSAAEQLPRELPEAAAKWLKAQSGRPQSCAQTGAGGTFAFTGLPEHWSGSLQTPQSHWVVLQPGQQGNPDGSRTLRLDAPQRDLVVATTLLPSVQGLVVWDDTGQVVPLPLVDAYGEFADGGHSPTMGMQGDATGHFLAGFYPGATSRRLQWLDPARRSKLVKVRLDVHAEGSAGSMHVALDEEQLREGREVVVRLPRALVTHFRTIDGTGKPIAGARVEVRNGNALSEPSDGDGRGTFVGEGRLVGARGYLVVPAVPQQAAAGTIDDPLAFALEPDNTLQLRLRTLDGSVPEANFVELRAAKDLFAGARFQGELDRSFGCTEADCGRTGKNQPDGSIVWTESTAGMTADAEGEITLHSLAPGLSCTAVVKDALGQELLEQALELPAAGATLAVEFVVASTPRHVSGRVLDAAGHPLAGARVKLQAGRADTELATDRDGAFDLHRFYTDEPVSLCVTLSGFAPQESEPLPRARDGQPIEFRLQPGHRVHVAARDPNGALVPVYVGATTGLRARCQPQELAKGEYVYSDLPPGEVTFTCEFSGQRFTLRHDTSEPEAMLRVPVPARAMVAAPAGWPEPDRQQGSLAAWATRLDERAEPFELRLERADEPPALLLPGRYRIELVLVRWQDGRAERTPQGPAAEVELRAGEQARVTLQ